MLGVTDLPTYLIGLVLIVLLPGPNSLYVLSVAARRGVRSGYRAAAGVWCGDTVLMVLSAAGVASLLQANALLFGVVKYAGAGYLTWLAFGMMRTAWSMWRTRREADPELAGDATGTSTAAGAGGATGATASASAATATATAKLERPYRRALVISLLNPKAILFFISFFVQFVDPAYAYPALSFVLLGALAQLASFLYLTALIFSGTRLSAAFRRRKRLSAGATSAAGVLFLGFAAKLTMAGA
ncbi:leucine efflux protein LeuE [Streptomyces sp. NPDC091272]|uniref:leucine efflux protein LeuE n=1 Tax=Streptomyces sp. NPDC091272 TaxID=3365981 RepID=UPI00380060CD